MTTTVYVPRDSSALSLGAHQVAKNIQTEAAKRGVDIKVAWAFHSYFSA